ncbi:hypothetical protein BJV78DRAFT_1220535 [Lactifluus subvellereus]|nr:hypothetical protein BJV78DRAFT_1220535 [Lactifluus subvellereus]
MGTVAARSIFRNGTHSLARPTVTTTLTTSRLANRAYGTMHDNDPEVLEREKRRNLARQPYQTSSPLDHSPGWNERLASTSEAYVKADQDASPVHDLASRTVAHLKVRDAPEEISGFATNDRDEVSGPLRSAPGVDGVVDIDDAYEEEIKEQEGAWTHKVKREHLEQAKVRRLALVLS